MIPPTSYFFHSEGGRDYLHISKALIYICALSDFKVNFPLENVLSSSEKLDSTIYIYPDIYYFIYSSELPIL
jgi:hypothetical protein